MNTTFQEAVKNMESLLNKLKTSKAIKVDVHGLGSVPKQGVYVFYEGGKALYIGRSNNMRERIKEHGATSSDQYGATFAFKLLREKICQQTGKKPTGTRKEIQGRHSDEYAQQRKRVRDMEIQVVEITDQVEQTVFEIYAILALGTTPKYNEFRTT